jgi:hypothetical protein
MSCSFRRIQPSSFLGIRRAVLAICIPFAGVRGAAAFEWFNDPTLQVPHPTVIATDLNGKTYPIVGVAGEHPQIVVDGATITLKSRAQSYQPMRAMGFAPGFINITKENASTKITARSFAYDKNGQQVPVGNSDDDGYFECSVVAAEDHPGCFVAVLFCQLRPNGEPIAVTTALAFGSLGDLKAGRESKAKIFKAYIAPVGTHYYYFIMVLSKGREIRTNLSHFNDQFFRHREVLEQQEMLEEYKEKFKAMDHPAVPYVRIPIQLPPEVDPHTLPPNFTASLVVTEAGLVDEIQLGDSLSPTARSAISSELGGWLFLPRLKQGNPVRTQIVMPLGIN